MIGYLYYRSSNSPNTLYCVSPVKANLDYRIMAELTIYEDCLLYKHIKLSNSGKSLPISALSTLDYIDY